MGRTATAQTDAQMHAEILSWSRSQGLFAGLALEGATLRQDLDDNKALYGKNLKVDPDMVRLEGLIKECALYEVDLHLGYDINTKVKIMVVPHKDDKK